MTELNTKEAPVTPASTSGASDREESKANRPPHITSISLTVDRGNSQYPDPIVEAIRILARHGRQIHEAEEAAARVKAADDDQDAQVISHQTVMPAAAGAEQ